MKEPALDFREMKGEEIARQFGWVRRLDEFAYKVHSQRLAKEYDVMQTEMGWACSCPDHQFRGMKCKHVRAVELSFILRKIVATEPTVIQAVSVGECPRCQSALIVKHSVRHNRSGDLQRYSCKGCGLRFSKNLGFEGMKASPEAVTQAMQLYFTGESLRNVQKFLRLQGVNTSHVSVLNWIRKYVGLMEGYLDKLTPRVGDTWRTDELYLKVKGNTKYLFAMMDDDTRFWIAQQVADHKGTSDVRPMFKEAVETAGKRPKLLISDGAHNFHLAFKKELWSRNGPHPHHKRDITLGSEVHNNKMERLNGEVRDREKVMRGIKRADTPILKGYQLYHNFIRPHEGLNGATPAERAGIKVEGENKWKTIIENASVVSSAR
ncbi:MAG: DDE-type integrase/transposase/recombinase [Nitrososphaerales archaeon]|nr:DDE-type integrase/transposase/recombinase [Nitrososphaerales archaeon]